MGRQGPGWFCGLGVGSSCLCPMKETLFVTGARNRGSQTAGDKHRTETKTQIGGWGTCCTDWLAAVGKATAPDIVTCCFIRFSLQGFETSRNSVPLSNIMKTERKDVT